MSLEQLLAKLNYTLVILNRLVHFIYERQTDTVQISKNDMYCVHNYILYFDLCVLQENEIRYLSPILNFLLFR